VGQGWAQGRSWQRLRLLPLLSAGGGVKLPARVASNLHGFPTGTLSTTPPCFSPHSPQDWIPVKDNGAIAGAAAKEVTAALEAMGSDGHLATTDTASAQGALTFIRVGSGAWWQGWTGVAVDGVVGSGTHVESRQLGEGRCAWAALRSWTSGSGKPLGSPSACLWLTPLPPQNNTDCLDKPSVWIVGGDGWAYDVSLPAFGGKLAS